MLSGNKIKMTTLCLSFLALLSTSVVAQKTNDSPQLSGFNIPGVDIIVKKKPDGTVAAKTITDSSGVYSFTLDPGDYILQLGSSPSDKTRHITWDKYGSQRAVPLVKKTKWISVEGSLFKFSIEGDGITFGKATLLEDSTSFKDEQGKVVRTTRNIQMEIAIKDQGVTRVAGVKISGKVVSANKL